MIEGKRLEESINEFDTHVKQMGKTTKLYKDLIDYRLQLEETNTKIDKTISVLNEAQRRLDEQLDVNEENNNRIEKWQNAIEALIQENKQLKEEVIRGNKELEDMNIRSEKLHNDTVKVLKNIPQDISKQVQVNLQNLEVQMKGELNNTTQDIGNRINQFVDMQIQLNKGINSEITNFKDNTVRTLQHITEVQNKELEELREYKEENKRTLEKITKIIFINMCLIGIIWVMIFILYIK